MKLPPWVGIPLLNLAAAILFGLSAALLVTTALRSQLLQVGPGGELPASIKAIARKNTSQTDIRVITQRNLFDVKTSNPSRVAANGGTSPVDLSNLELIGTIISQAPSALLKMGDKVERFGLDARVPDTGRITAIGRNRVEMRLLSGQQAVLIPPVKKAAKTPPAPRTANRRNASSAASKNQYGISPLSENRWLIPRQAAEQVRANMSTILQQARLVPRVVRGETIGFSVVRTGPLLQQLGLRRGDVLQQVNGLALDSPDKALQIFTQLQEARNISLSLTRGQQQLSFDYEVR